MHIGTADSGSPLPPIQQPHSISFSQPVNPVRTEQHGGLLASVIQQLLSTLTTPHPLHNTTPWLTRKYMFLSQSCINYYLPSFRCSYLSTVVRLSFRLLLLASSFCLLLLNFSEHMIKLQFLKIVIRYAIIKLIEVTKRGF